MCERTDLDDSSLIEMGLETIFTTPSPDAAFIARLEQQLLARGAARPGKVDTGPLRLLGRHRWAMVTLGILLVMTVAIIAVDPQKVWAGLQRLLDDYVPGLGFVNMDQAWVLVEPVEVSREEVTIRVEHVVASPDRTVVLFNTVAGIRHLIFPLSEHKWENTQIFGDFEAFLLLPDDQRLGVIAKTLRVGGGALAFPPLPAGTDIDEVTLELPRLPLLPAGAAPENWAILLPLRPVTEEVIADLGVQVYVLSDASDTHEGITFRVLEVAHSPDETAIHVRVDQDPEVGYLWLMRPRAFDSSRYGIQLYDGHVFYAAQDIDAWSPVKYEDPRVLFDQGAPVGPQATGYEDMWTFAPLWHSPYSLTLQIDWVETIVPIEGVDFTVDLGDDSQVGEWQALDVTLTVDGYSMHITRGKLVELSDSPGWKLVLEGAPVEWERSGRVLQSAWLRGDSPVVGGSIDGGDWVRELGDSTWRLEDPAAPLRGSIFLSELPEGPIHLWVESLFVRVSGPWAVTWTIPQMVELDE